jgi:type IV pilus assembly protein PilC
MFLFAGFVLAWVMILIMPRFRNIFDDFGTPLPRITVALIDVTSWLAVYGWLLLVIPLVVLLTVAITGIGVHAKDRAGVLARIISELRWALPVTRALDYGLGMAKAARSMAMGIRSGVGTERAVALTSTVSVTNHLRYRLAEFAEEVQAGIAPHTAARHAKLGDVFVCALEMVARGEDAERALGHAADYYEAIAYRWWHALVAITGPLTTLAIAVVVGFIALALFLPLIALINSVSGSF